NGMAPGAPDVTEPTERVGRGGRDRAADTTDTGATEDTGRVRRRDRGTTDSTTPGDQAPSTTHDMTAMEPAPGATKTAAAGAGSGRWSDPATWGGAVPVESDVVAIQRDVLLDVDAAVAGLDIAAGGVLTFDPAASRHLASSRNIVVAGTLVMRPAAATAVHQVELVGVDEAGFMGGHSEAPVESDVGVWVVGSGLLDLVGTRKTSWTNLSGAAASGDRTITVDDATGWLVGDEIVVTPTEPPTVDKHWEHHDRCTITSLRGNRIGLDAPLEFAHPEVAIRTDLVHRAEVLNLSRNVVISGRPEGRAHLMLLQTTQPQHLAHVAVHDMGPRQGDEEVLGRYAIHFHNCRDGSTGSTVDSVVVRDSTGHGFASHLSNGVTFTECVAHDMVDDAFWWDLGLDGQGRDLVPSDGIVYDRCVAHFVKSGANSKFNLTGFMMGVGEGNIARGCVATGVQGGAESSCGYNWPSLSRGDSTWTFEGNMAHNCHHSGIYFWQNGKPRAIVDGFTAYHCGQGIFAGAYANLVSYVNSTIFACEDDGLVISALPAGDGERTAETIRYDGMYIDQAGLTEFAVRVTKHLSRGGRVTELTGSTFKGGTTAQFGLPEDGEHPQLYDFTNCTFEGNEFWLASGVPPETALNVTGPGGSYVVRRADQPGEPRPAWNASVTPA
ncbi:MAG: right-handed parallel beta-helix repeat-containing protein, partial [Ilumatobacteraceae bacterium]